MQTAEATAWTQTDPFAEPSKIFKQLKLCGVRHTYFNQNQISSGARIMGCYYCSMHSPLLTLLMARDSPQQPTTISYLQSKKLQVQKHCGLVRSATLRLYFILMFLVPLQEVALIAK